MDPEGNGNEMSGPEGDSVSTADGPGGAVIRDRYKVDLEESNILEVGSQLVPLKDEKDRYIVLGRSPSAHRKWGGKGLLELGAIGEHQRSGEDLFGRKVFLDAAFPHIIFICGKRGSGKSYTLGIFAEELMRTAMGVGAVLIDPIGIFWSLKLQNTSEQEVRSLGDWGLTAHSFPEVRVLVPEGSQVDGLSASDGPFSIAVGEMTADDWCQVFDIDRFKTQGLMIGTVIEQVRKGYDSVTEGRIFHVAGKKGHYSIGDILQCIETSLIINSKTGGYNPQTRRSIAARFMAAAAWGVFDINGTPLRDLSSQNRVTVIDISDPNLGDSKRSLITGIIARKLLSARIRAARLEEKGELDENDPEGIPVTWLLIDEAHIILPHGKQSPATEALIEYAKQGRKPGCALVLATQRPASTSDEILSQVDILIGHNLALEDDMTALRRRVPAKLPPEFANSDFIRAISVGTGIMADQRTQQRAFLLKLRPRLSYHAGSSAVPKLFMDKSEKEKVVPLSSAQGEWRRERNVAPTVPVPSLTVPKTYGPAGKIEVVAPSVELDGASPSGKGTGHEAQREPLKEQIGSLGRRDLEWMCEVLGLSKEGDEIDLLKRIADHEKERSESGEGQLMKAVDLKDVRETVEASRPLREEGERITEGLERLETNLKEKVAMKSGGKERARTENKRRKGKKFVVVWGDSEKDDGPSKEMLDGMVAQIESLKKEMEDWKATMKERTMENPLTNEVLSKMEVERREGLERLSMMEGSLKEQIERLERRFEVADAESKKPSALGKGVKALFEDGPFEVVKGKGGKERTRSGLKPEARKGPMKKNRVLKKGEELIGISPKVGPQEAVIAAKKALRRTLLGGPKEEIMEVRAVYIPIYRFLVAYKGLLGSRKHGDVFIDGLLGELVLSWGKKLSRSNGLSMVLSLTDMEMQLLSVLEHKGKDEMALSRGSGLSQRDVRKVIGSLSKKGLARRTSAGGNVYLHSLGSDVYLPRKPWMKDPGVKPVRLTDVDEPMLRPRIGPEEAREMVDFISSGSVIEHSDVIYYPFYVARIIGEGRERYIALNGVSGRIDSDLSPVLKDVFAGME